MRYIARELESKIARLSQEYSCIILTEARQTGKTTLLKKISGRFRHYVTLDDFEERALAQKDPALFCSFIRHPSLLMKSNTRLSFFHKNCN